MRSFAFVLLVSSLPCLATSATAQDADQGGLETQGRVVTLDTGSARLLKAYSPRTDAESLVQFEHQSYQVLNRRALSMKNASLLIFRGDRLSMKSRLFCERLIAQGVPAIDLAAYGLEQKSVARQQRIADQGTGHAYFGQVSEQSSYVVSLAIDQFQKVASDF